MGRLAHHGCELPEQHVVDHLPNLAEDGAASRRPGHRELLRVVRVVLAHFGERVRQVGLRVRELGHAPARPDELEYHPTDLVYVHGLTNALRDRLANVAHECRVRVYLGT